MELGSPPLYSVLTQAQRVNDHRFYLSLGSYAVVLNFILEYSETLRNDKIIALMDTKDYKNKCYFTQSFLI